MPLRPTIVIFLASLLTLSAYAQRPNRNTGPQANVWKLSNSKNIEGVSTAMLELASDSLIFGQPVRLQIRCSEIQKPGALKAWVWFVYEPDFVSERAEIKTGIIIDLADIRTRFDEETPAFHPNIHERKDRGLMLMDSEYLLPKILKSKKLFLEFTPVDRAKQLATFTLRDAAVQFKRLPCAASIQ